nr:MAG TPA: hypothetical protein [Caudoviricetes sp.]
MARITYELSETYASITRPIAINIVRQVMEQLKIDSTIPLTFPGANGKTTVWHANAIPNKENTQFQADQKMIVNIKETYIEDQLLTMAAQVNDSPDIFRDPIGISIHPLYSRTKVTVSFTYQTRDRWEAESFRDNWIRMIAERRENMPFFAEYTYPIPEAIDKVLYLLYLTRSLTRDDFPTYSDYVFGYGIDNLTSLTNQIGKGDTLAVSEVQQHINGHFTEPTPPELEKSEVGAVWTANFDLEYFYDKPISVMIKYPLLIDNTLVNPVLYPKLPFDIQTVKVDRKFLTRQWFNEIQNDLGYQFHVRGAYIRIPEFDDWTQFVKWKEQRPLLSAMLIVDPDNPTEVCNLTQMGEWGLHESLVPYFKQYHNELTIQTEFPFYVEIYEDNVKLHHDMYYVDEDLNVFTYHDMDTTKMYHMVIHMTTDVRNMSKEGQARFFRNPPLVNCWLDLRLGFKPKEGYPEVGAGGTVKYESWKRLSDIYNLGSEGAIGFYHPGRLMATVGMFTVASHREED